MGSGFPLEGMREITILAFNAILWTVYGNLLACAGDDRVRTCGVFGPSKAVDLCYALKGAMIETLRGGSILTFPPQPRSQILVDIDDGGELFR